ncbi:uncharacterized protein N7529_004311 [Penicillium soppii]|jgi:DHA1 family multidrug resistance protein-like MFS transporter|uniref:uncharacterized protein n=1 Tax=Penicillium soppii TaxID=69789 RepID=UPI002547CA88|nr:uncharacterized protein N7529_004311 [Penicillium soppii]KAJ5871958.1 hypothetical protein N7529_004311 [Penicillium soppii]
MIETIRDTGFGKLVRFFSGRRLLRFPEEQNPSIWNAYVKAPEMKPEETGLSEPDSYEEDLEAYGLYSVMSQASRVGRRTSTTASALSAQNRSSPIVISWGPNDTEVFLP